MVSVLTHSAPLWNLPAHKASCLESLLYLEMMGIQYKRRISYYNINPFIEDINPLPIIQYAKKPNPKKNINEDENSLCFKSTNIYDFLLSKNEKNLNESLSPTQKADAIALSSLIRDRLHLVTLHQIFANDENWIQYCQQIGHHLPFIIRKYLLQKEREIAIHLLQKNQIITESDAKKLLVECLNVLFMKRTQMKEIKEYHLRDENELKKDAEYETYFGDGFCSLDAVLCSEIAVLHCSQLPNKYLDDYQNCNYQRKLSQLIKYVQSVFQYFNCAIYNKLENADNYYDGQLSLIENMKDGNDRFVGGIKNWKDIGDKNTKNKEGFASIWWKSHKESQPSIVFAAGSVTVLAIYWKFFQPH